MSRYKDRFNRGLGESPALQKCLCLYREVPDNPKTLCLDLKLRNSLDKTVLCVTREAHLLLIV